MYNKIAHLGDIHLRKSPSRNEEYESVFVNTIKSLKKEKPDIIVIVGDLVNDYIDLQGEQLMLADKFINNLIDIAPVRITRGNHDFSVKNRNRVDAIQAIVNRFKNSDIKYYNSTGFYYDDNIIWAVWHHGDKNNNPWKRKEGKDLLKNKPDDKTIIDLFHDPIHGCKSATNFEMKSKYYYKLRDFKGDYSFFGDIHKEQTFSNDTKGYCGSLIAQDFSEGDDLFHGYYLWDIKENKLKKIKINNDWSFKNVLITQFTDFDDLDFEIDEPSKYIKVRFIWNTLSAIRNKENERKLKDYVKSKYNVISIHNKNDFIVEDKIEVDETIDIEDINQQEVQHQFFREYLEKIGVEDDMIEDIIKLDIEITSKIDLDPNTNIEWDIVKFGGVNFMSYEKVDIDWKDKKGLIQIHGENTGGKTTLLKLITYVIFGKTLETKTRQKFGDVRYLNNKLDIDFCNGYVVIEANGEYFGVQRRTDVEKNKSGEITGAPTKVYYYTLSGPDDKMTDDNCVENLNEVEKNKTQNKIETILGSFDNFISRVLTTSDTLNKILSNDISVFTDSLLHESGLDIFGKKNDALKKHLKETQKKERIVCDVTKKQEEIKTIKTEIDLLIKENDEINKIKIPDIKDKITKGNDYIENLTKKIFNIDDEIVNLDVDEANKTIDEYEKEIKNLNIEKTNLIESIKNLKKSYDEKKLNDLIDKKDKHKEEEHNKKIKIKDIESKINDEEHKIEIINGNIFTYKKEGKDKREEIDDLKKSKVCPTCGSDLSDEHRKHVDEKIEKIKKEMFVIADNIKAEQKKIDDTHKPIIMGFENDKEEIENSIELANNEMESILAEIGDLTNDKNEVEDRERKQKDYDYIPIKIQNYELKRDDLKNKIKLKEENLKNIEKNKKINNNISIVKEKIKLLNDEKDELTEKLSDNKNDINNKNQKIDDINKLIEDFNEQEYQDSVINFYKKCVHRDGIPKHLLINSVIPKVNTILEKILSSAQFKIWLDTEDLRPKLVYYDTPKAIIDAIGSSGKERTFASIVLKNGLNEINVKSKPKIFLLDEVTGKLVNESVDEFKELLNLLKEKYERFIIIEHNHEINPDHIIYVVKDDNYISSAQIESIN